MKRDLKVRSLFFSLISVGSIGISAALVGPRNLNEELNDAITGGRTEKIKNLIRKGADVNAKNKRNKQTPLILAARQDKHLDKQMVSVILKLLAYEADPTAKDMWEMTALMWAVRNGLINVTIKLLQDRKVKLNINIQDKEGNTALIHAVRDSGKVSPYDLVKMVTILLLNGADPTITNQLEQTALSYANITGQLLIEHLLNADKAAIRDSLQKIGFRDGPSEEHPYVIKRKGKKVKKRNY